MGRCKNMVAIKAARWATESTPFTVRRTKSGSRISPDTISKFSRVSLGKSSSQPHESKNYIGPSQPLGCHH